MTVITLVGAGGVLAVVAIMFCWVYWPRWRYSWKHAKHVIDLTQTEQEVAPEYGWVTRDMPRRTYEPFADDYRDWRTQTFDSLSPDALDEAGRARRGT